jgi:hypothetical protein
MPTDNQLVIATVANLVTFTKKPVTIGQIADSFGVPIAKVKLIFAAYPRLIVADGDLLVTPLKNEHLVCYCFNKNKCGAPYVCQRLHVCCAWLYQRCESPSSCNFDHDVFRLEANVALLRSLGIGHWPTADVKLLVLCLEKNTAAICNSYNSGKSKLCKKGATCEHLHICADFVNLETCTGSCGLNHRFGQAENHKKTQELYGLEHDGIIDEPPQLRCRLSMKLNSCPRSLSYDALVTDHLVQHGNNLKKILVHPKKM